MRTCRLLLLVFAGLAAAMATDPKQAEKPFKDGLRFEQDSQWKEAEAAYSEAIQLNPSSVLYHLHRARVRFSSSDYSHALEDATAATRLEPTNGEAFQLLGDIDGKLSYQRQAVTDYTRAIELGVTSAAVYNSRAAALYGPERIRFRPRRLHHRNQAASG